MEQIHCFMWLTADCMIFRSIRANSPTIISHHLCVNHQLLNTSCNCTFEYDHYSLALHFHCIKYENVYTFIDKAIKVKKYIIVKSEIKTRGLISNIPKMEDFLQNMNTFHDTDQSRNNAIKLTIET